MNFFRIRIHYHIIALCFLISFVLLTPSESRIMSTSGPFFKSLQVYLNIIHPYLLCSFCYHIRLHVLICGWIFFSDMFVEISFVILKSFYFAWIAWLYLGIFWISLLFICFLQFFCQSYLLSFFKKIFHSIESVCFFFSSFLLSFLLLLSLF